MTNTPDIPAGRRVGTEPEQSPDLQEALEYLRTSGIRTIELVASALRRANSTDPQEYPDFAAKAHDMHRHAAFVEIVLKELGIAAEDIVHTKRSEFGSTPPDPTKPRGNL